jgi:hypothetical protein
MPHPTSNFSTGKPEEGSLELTEDIIPARAYWFY